MKLEHFKLSAKPATASQDVGPVLPPLSLSEAVDTWVLMLGLASAEDLDARPGTVLPAYTINSITETLWSYGAADRVTLVLAYQQLLQRMMVVVGSTIEIAIQTELHSRDGMVEVEVEEAGLIQVHEATKPCSTRRQRTGSRMRSPS